MMLLDVNILVNAHRKDAPHHALLRGWLEDLINGDQAYGIADIVLSGFLRVVTHTAIFNPPSGTSASRSSHPVDGRELFPSTHARNDQWGRHLSKARTVVRRELL